MAKKSRGLVEEMQGLARKSRGLVEEMQSFGHQKVEVYFSLVEEMQLKTTIKIVFVGFANGKLSQVKTDGNLNLQQLFLLIKVFHSVSLRF